MRSRDMADYLSFTIDLLVFLILKRFFLISKLNIKIFGNFSI